MSEQQVQEKKKRIFCNLCKRNTNHFTAGSHQTSQYDENSGWGESSTYTLWVCAGCETATLESDYTNTDMVDGFGEETVEVRYSPKRVDDDLAPKVFIKLKPKLKQIYKEAISCFNDGSLLLCTVGLRSLLEGVCDDKRIKGRNLRAKIDNLQPLLANKSIVKNLHHFRFTGNQAVHDLEAPAYSEAKLAIEVMEDLLNFLYELDYKASRLRASVRERKQLARKRDSAKRAGVPFNPFQSSVSTPPNPKP